jgi:hypothetical protein
VEGVTCGQTIGIVTLAYPLELHLRHESHGGQQQCLPKQTAHSQTHLFVEVGPRQMDVRVTYDM